MVYNFFQRREVEAMIAAKAVPLGSRGSSAQEVKRYTALQRWWADLGNRDNARACVLVSGDSISEGQGAGTVANRWVTRMQANLRSTFTTTGLTAYGAGFVPPYYQSVLPQPYSALSPTGLSQRRDVGLGGRGVNLAAAQQMDFPASTMTSFRIHWKYSAFGTNLYPKIDGVATSPSSFATNTGSGMQFTSYTTTAGSHTIALAKANNGNDGWFGGIEFFNGDESKGVHVYDGSRSGDMASDQGGTLYKDGHWGVAGLLNPGLIIVALGANDAYFNTVTAFKTNLTATLANLRAKCPTSSVVFVVEYQRTDTLKAPWAQYVDVVYAVANTDPAACVLDLNLRMPRVGAAQTYGLYADSVHPNVKGHGFMADTIGRFISPH